MEVDFSPDLQTKLNRLAAEQGRDTKALVQEAVERFVRHDEWFIREVEKGLAAPTGESSSNTKKSARSLMAGIPADSNSLDGTRCPRPHTDLRLHRRT